MPGGVEVTMSDWAGIEAQLREPLALARRPVAVAFRAAVPSGVPRFEGTVPSGCSFWRLASEGRVFATVGADHANCAIGGYTHNIPLPPGRANELGETLAFMTGIGYVRAEEVPSIPRLPATPGAVVYAPLGDTPVEPDVVVVVGRPGRLMLLGEAATRSGAGAGLPILGRPTCMALPAALAAGQPVASVGCVGNRVYNYLGDEDLYVALPAATLGRIVAELGTIVAANAQLAAYHTERRRRLSTP
jgi:uncharacterized protein (DUF169 family)